MFSVSENDYILSLVNRYSLEGYNYYLVHSNTRLDDITNVITFYFSKNEIKALSEDIFAIPEDSLKIEITSSFYETNGIDVDTVVEFSGTAIVSDLDYCYTNAVVDYSLITGVLNPDIRINQGTDVFNYNYSGLTLFMVVIIFCYMFIKSILRIKK